MVEQVYLVSCRFKGPQGRQQTSVTSTSLIAVSNQGRTLVVTVAVTLIVRDPVTLVVIGLVTLFDPVCLPLHTGTAQFPVQCCCNTLAKKMIAQDLLAPGGSIPCTQICNCIPSAPLGKTQITQVARHKHYQYLVSADGVADLQGGSTSGTQECGEGPLRQFWEPVDKWCPYPYPTPTKSSLQDYFSDPVKHGYSLHYPLTNAHKTQQGTIYQHCSNQDDHRSSLEVAVSSHTTAALVKPMEVAGEHDSLKTAFHP